MCLFCQIVEGTQSAERVLDEPEVVGFLDHRPVFHGHVLLVPRAHHVTLAELPPALLVPLFGAAQRVALAVELALGAEGSFVAMNNRVSQSVAHLHVHVVPRKKKDGLRGFFWPRVVYRDAAHLAEVGAALRKALG